MSQRPVTVYVKTRGGALKVESGSSNTTVIAQTDSSAQQPPLAPVVPKDHVLPAGPGG